LPSGRAIAIAEISKLQQLLAQLPAAVRSTWLVRRLADALGYVQQRGSADGFEQRLEVLAARDADESDRSYELVRTVTWAIPILGFLGTVVGITIAIANITPEQLQDSLSEVVGGLAVAFDTTALSLALAMVIVLSKFFVERAEQAVLARVDSAVEETLLHRFERLDPETSNFLTAVEGVANVVMQATRDAWREQGQLWTRTIEQIGDAQVAALQNAAQRTIDQTSQLARQLATDQAFQFRDVVKRLELLTDATGATLTGLREFSREAIAAARDEAHQNSVRQDTQFQHFLTGLENLRNLCHKSLDEVASKMTAHQAAARRQTELLAQLVADEGRLTKLQHALNSNLATLANVQALDDAIHSLSAAAHMLTARAGRASPFAAPPLAGDDSDETDVREAA
jgi:biopolymer transport protein ExbB/TolQ